MRWRGGPSAAGSVLPAVYAMPPASLPSARLARTCACRTAGGELRGIHRHRGGERRRARLRAGRKERVKACAAVMVNLLLCAPSWTSTRISASAIPPQPWGSSAVLLGTEWLGVPKLLPGDRSEGKFRGVLSNAGNECAGEKRICSFFPCVNPQLVYNE